MTGQSQPEVRNVSQDVVLARLRIGHTRITHSYLINKKNIRIVLDVMHPLRPFHIHTETEPKPNRKNKIH